MGWWKVQNTDDVVGDDAFDTLRDATVEIAALYERELGRLPTRCEWQRLVQRALAPQGTLGFSDQSSLFAEHARPRAVEIVLDERAGTES